jgi:septal ring factor EnvC (AmiA/AmiB activator)
LLHAEKGENYMDNDSEFERIYRQLERQSEKIDHSSNEMRNLAESVSQLAQAVAAKEVNDHHMVKSIDEIKTDIDSLEEKVRSLEKISAGDDMMRKVFWVALSLLLTTVLGAIIAMVIIK